MWYTLLFLAEGNKEKKRRREEYVKFALGLALQRLKSSFPNMLFGRMSKGITFCRQYFPVFPDDQPLWYVNLILCAALCTVATDHEVSFLYA
jgi:hypothetical protein